MVQNATRRARRRERDILLAAARQFRLKGFAGSGMRDIAAALGMTVGNLYYYFESKEALLGFCQEEALRRLAALATWAGRQTQLTADQRLFLLIRGHVLCLNEAIPGSLAHMQGEELSPEWRRRIDGARRQYELAWRRCIRDGIAEGRLRDTDDKLAALAGLGAVNWTVKWFQSDGERSADDIGVEFAGLLVRGLLAEGVSFEVPDLPMPEFVWDGECFDEIFPEGER